MPYPGCLVKFDASSSTANGGTIIEYTWNFGDNSPIIKTANAEITHTYVTAGKYLVTLNVTDSEGLWSTTTKPITVYAPYGPTAAFTYYPLEPFIGAFITFNASISVPGWNGTYYPKITTYIWNFGDGSAEIIENDPITNHTYTSAGNFTVTLKIIDELGQWSFASKNITVTSVQVWHDLAVTDILYISEVYKGWTVNITVKVYNNGTVSESFRLILYLNTTVLFNQTISLAPLESRSLIYSLNTASFETGYYVLKAEAVPVPNESNVSNNILQKQFRIKRMGDINNDDVVDSSDLGMLGISWGSIIGDANFNIQCDLNQDTAVDSSDLGLLGMNWG
jgi:PKD repeat protein